MITPDGKHCTIPGVIVWDGITNPSTDNAVGVPRFSCKIVVNPNAPELAELHQLATNELNEGQFRGVLPHGGLWIMTAVEPTSKFNIDGMFNGFTWLNASTYDGQPQVYDQNGKLIPAMQLSGYIHAGTVVELLVKAKSYDNTSKGIKADLRGLKIIDHTGPRLQISGGIDAATVFAAHGQAGPNGMQAAPMQTQPQQVPQAAPMQTQQQQAPINNSPATIPNGVPAAGGVHIQQNVVQPADNQLAAPGAPPVGAGGGNPGQQQQVPGQQQQVTPNVSYTQP